MVRFAHIRLVVLGLALLAGGPALAEGYPRQVSEPEAGSPEATVQQALQVALGDDEGAFEAYLALVHPDRKTTDRAIEQLRRYSWKRFRSQAGDYVVEGTETDFVVTRRDPEVLDAEASHVRLFLDPVRDAKRTYPTPIRLERHEGSWLITANSL